MTTVQPRIAHVACPHNCPDACLMDVVVQDGRAVDISGNKEHPYTRGALCAKVNRFLDRVYAPERLLYPVKRMGPKGPGAAFERISWDEAIDTIAQKIRAAIAEHGPQSILPYSYSGVLGIYQGWGFDRRFAHALGASRLDRTICDGAYNAAAHYLPDVFQGFPPEGLVESRLIIILGQQPPQHRYAYLALGAGGQTPRRQDYHHRPLSLPHGARLRRAPLYSPRHQRRPRAGPDEGDCRRRTGRPRLRRPLHRRL